jgi:hypothetical protein
MLPNEKLNFPGFLPCFQTTEFGFEHVPSPNSLIFITRDLIELGVLHRGDKMRGGDPEGTGLTTNEKVINYLSTDSINELLPSNLADARPPARYFS